MIDVPTGKFDMGSPLDETGRFSDETMHEVIISQPFSLGRAEVDWTIWNSIRDWALQNGYRDLASGSNGFNGKEGTSHPVTNISWWDAIYWCNARSEREGLSPVYYRTQSINTDSVVREGFGPVFADQSSNGYRLPTEAEWEYACRAGTETAYYTGDSQAEGPNCIEEENLSSAGWYCFNSESNTHVFTESVPNRFGLSDMHGNLFEWCWDWYGSYPNEALAQNPLGPTDGTQRILRGGSWISTAAQARSAYRHALAPATTFYNIGFRVARSVHD